MLKIGLDVGNGSIVMAVNDGNAMKTRVLASTFGVADREVISVVGGNNPYQAYKLSNGTTYALGYEAVKSYHADFLDSYSRDNRYESESFKLMNHLALLEATTMMTKSKVIEVELELGVPAEYFRKDTVNTLRSWFASPLAAEVNGETVVLMVRKTEVISQPIAVFLDAYYADDGLVRDEKLISQDVLIIDGGSGTLDLAHLRGGAVVKQSSEAVGINDVYAKVISEIRKLHPTFRIDPIRLEAQLRAQDAQATKIVAGGHFSVDVTKMLQTATEEVWTRTKNAIQRQFPAVDQFERILLAGGSAGGAFENHFRSWNPFVTVVDRPQESIARGLCKHLMAAEVATHV